MEFSEDFVAVQSALFSSHNAIGDFTAVKHRGGNESKILRVVEDLKACLTSKKYLRKGKINPKYDQKLKEIHLFLVLNTNFSNRKILTNEKFSHLIGIIPQFSKCMLANVVWNLDLCRYYSEAIYSLPIEISLELLENANNCVKKSEPYSVLEQVSILAQAIYIKLYHIRNEITDESKISSSITTFLKRFTELLQNYISPETELMSNWPEAEMYKYMGVAILKILNLLKTCLNIFLNDAAAPILDLYRIYENFAPYSPEKLDKSAQSLKQCNIALISTSEANLIAVTVDIFCAWQEFQHNNATLQRNIGTLAYEIDQQLENFIDCGNLPNLLKAIAVKPKTIHDIINEADIMDIIKNVVVKNDEQIFWFKALLKHGVLKSPLAIETFKSVSNLIDEEDFLFLLNYCANHSESENYELKKLLVENVKQFSEVKIIKVIEEYFTNGLNNFYEKDNFDAEITEMFNKISVEKSLPLKEISSLVLQNPVKLIARLLDESMKSINNLSNLIQIFMFIKPICYIHNKEEENSCLFEITLRYLKTCDFEPNAESCFIELMKKFVENELLSEKILEELFKIIESSAEIGNLKKTLLALSICNVLPVTVLATYEVVTLILRLSSLLSKIRWNFFTYNEEKVLVVSKTLSLLRFYKNYIRGITLYEENLNNSADKLENKIDSYHLFISKHKPTSFVTFVSPGYDKNGNNNEQVCRLLKLLPSCSPEEWNLVAKYLITDKNPLEILQIYIDVILILSEVSKKSLDNHNSLSYCYQQFCIVCKNVIYPLIESDVEMEKSFIKNMLSLLKNLPNQIQNAVEISLVSLFNFEVLKSMKNDRDFMYILISISHLEICKIISSKMAS